VISGDLVDRPSTQAYDHLTRLLAPLRIPFAVVPGNHDDRAMLRAALPGGGYTQATGALHSVRAAADIDLVLIDSTVPGCDYGALDAATLSWLDTALGMSPARPALIFLHHPPFATGIAHMDVQNLRNAPDLAAVLRRHKRAQLLAAGHVHRAVGAIFSGIPATICPAPSHAVALDLDSNLPPSFKTEPPAFHLHIWFPGEGFGSVATHLVPIGEFAGPHPFFSADGRYL
jgi:3',5'-cyclic-AMP phosphodiesterase